MQTVRDVVWVTHTWGREGERKRARVKANNASSQTHSNHLFHASSYWQIIQNIKLHSSDNRTIYTHLSEKDVLEGDPYHTA